jgi:hypothetical protein
MARNPNAATIKNYVNRRRDLQSQIKTLRDSKRQQMASIDSSIKHTKDVNQRRTLRSRKADIRESFNHRIDNLQRQSKQLLEQTKLLRRR